MMLFVTDCCGAEGPLEPPEGAARRRGFLFFTTSPTITLMFMSFLLVALFLMDGIALRKAKILSAQTSVLGESPRSLRSMTTAKGDFMNLTRFKTAGAASRCFS